MQMAAFIGLFKPIANSARCGDNIMITDFAI